MLHLALRLDAIGSGASGIVLLIGGQLLADPIGAPEELLWVTGVVLIAYAVTLWRVDSRERPSQAAIRAVIGFNVVWAVASLLVVVLAWLPLTPLGAALVVTQAILVVLVAQLQYIGLRGMRIEVTHP